MRFRRGLLLAGAVLFACGLGEGIVRTHDAIAFGHPLGEPVCVEARPKGRIRADPELGWRAMENGRYSGSARRADGSRQDYLSTTDPEGFRRSGIPGARRPRILAIGDSFTHALTVSDGRTYHAVAGDLLSAEVFAYGVIGYGTLQEYMAMDRHLDRIRPDLILWQFCGNDFHNNHPALERGSRLHNNGKVRPFWIDGRVSYLSPRLRGPVPFWALSRSRLLSRMYWATRREQDAGKDADERVAALGLSHPPFAESCRVTDALMGRVKARAGGVPVVAFATDAQPPYPGLFRGICSAHGIHYVEGVGAALAAAEAAGRVVRLEDLGHWSEDGHRIAGEALAAEIRRLGLLPAE